MREKNRRSLAMMFSSSNSLLPTFESHYTCEPHDVTKTPALKKDCGTVEDCFR